MVKLKVIFVKLNNFIYRSLRFFVGSSEDSRKRKNIRFGVYFFLVLLANVLLGKNIGSMHYPWYANVSIFLLLNINILIVLVLFIIIFRNIARLMSERRERSFGAKLQTKLAIFMVILIILPMSVMYFLSTKMTNDSIEKWFDSNVSRTLNEARNMARNYKAAEYRRLLAGSEGLAAVIGNMLNNADEETEINSELARYVDSNVYAALALYVDGALLYAVNDGNANYFNFIKPTLLTSISAERKARQELVMKGNEHYFWSGVPIYSRGAVSGTLFTAVTADVALVKGADELLNMHEMFSQFRYFSYPIKKAFNTSHFIAAMLVVFGSIWGSMVFVRSITEPLKNLTRASGRISRGKFDVLVPISGNDEITYLSKAFNYMATRMNQYTLELQGKNRELNNALHQISRDKMYIDIIYRNVDSALMLFSKDRQLLKANTAAEELVALGGDMYHEFVESTLISFIESEDTESMTQVDMDIEQEMRNFYIHTSKIFNSAGELENIVMVLDDNTHLMNLQRITLWREVATRITHEIKNPLTPIRLTAERVKKRSKEINEQAVRELVNNSMQMIITEVDELIHLAEEFNMFARAPSVIRAEIDIKAMVLEVIELYSRNKSVSFNADIPAVSIKGDRHQLKRLFINLIQNAIQAMPEGGIINVYGELESDCLVICVEDNGNGIAVEDIPNVFIPYFSKKPDGTGLGLAIVHKIVDEHGGSIEVDSKAGEYTRFKIKLPYTS